MAKTLRVAVFALALSLLSHSLPVRAGDAGFGLNLGLNMSELAGKNAKRDQSFRYGVVVGGLMYAWMDIIGIQLELNYVQKGTRYDVFVTDGLPDNGDSTLKFNYIQMPLIVMAGLPLDDMRLFAEFGVTFAFLVGAEIEVAYDSMPDYSDDMYDTTAGFDMGILGGLGLQMNMFALGVRYEWGILTTDSQPIGGYVINAERYNRSLTLLGSLRF